jgi:hypothetical protein
MDPINSQEVLAARNLLTQAALIEGIEHTPFEVRTIEKQLDVAVNEAQAIAVGFPFRSVFVIDATDSAVYVNLKPQTQDSFQGSIKLSKKDSLVFELPQSAGYLWWPAQPGKTITIVLFVTAEFRPGNFLVTSTSAIEGSAVRTLIPVSTIVGTFLILPANSSRKKATIYNGSGSTVWMGDSAVTYGSGVPIETGAFIEWKNTAALYGNGNYPSTDTICGIEEE